MSDWLHDLPLIWMALVIFGVIYVLAAVIQIVVRLLATGDRLRAFKAISPGMLSPLGIIFGLFVVFTAAQVWNDTDHANAAVNREASALKSVLVLSGGFPGEPDAHFAGLIRRYVEETATQEWPMMARQAATLSISPAPLAEALQQALALSPGGPGQQIAQREIVTSLENALEARRQRIHVSQSQVNLTKWMCLVLQAICAFFAIAIVHSENRLASAISMGMFATGVAASVLLILAHDRPFLGQLAIGPEPLLQVMPKMPKS
ncbi:hypothetical protein [Bradyrhizobium sp.]|jgi:hypothetical protein|uniref:bestrophin-like domain n=1 Tax=Bradyrhizobium sp. TaxID=376 RepID=UPI002D71904D|nr:hypothetical protein [Bradyrhizobium sp.]HZR72613.1 hypothetical protein [Bradyrhizobium sp.]